MSNKYASELASSTMAGVGMAGVGEVLLQVGIGLAIAASMTTSGHHLTEQYLSQTSLSLSTEGIKETRRTGLPLSTLTGGTFTIEQPSNISPIDSLKDTVAQVYAEMLSTQESLGYEFQKVLDDNLWDLYES